MFQAKEFAEERKWPRQSLASARPPIGVWVFIMMERKSGVVEFSSGKGWYLVRVGPPSSIEIYFLRQKFIRSGIACDIGYEVDFSAGPALNNGQRPTALNADVRPPTPPMPTVVDILAKAVKAVQS